MIAVGRAELDITQQNSANSFIDVLRPDIVIKATAYTAVDRAELEPGLTISINRDGAAHLAQVCVESNIHLMHLSTGYIFGGCKEGRYVETDAPNPGGVLRWMHFQLTPYTRSKLVRVIRGEVFDVTVDTRKGGPAFGNHVSVMLNDQNKHQLFPPRGFAHSFVALSDVAIFPVRWITTILQNVIGGLCLMTLC